MELLNNFDPNLLFVILASVMVIMLVFILILWGQLSRIKRKFNRLMRGSRSTSVEDLIASMQDKVEQFSNKNEEHEQVIEAMEMKVKSMKSNVGIIRYNAFEDQGSDLSFSIAIVDEQKNGAVLTGIYGREQTFIYGKPVMNGEAEHTLSPEEQKAIAKAVKKN